MVVEVTTEQNFKLRQIELALNQPSTKKEDIITVFLALQKQCFVMSNNVVNLVSKWPLPTNTAQPTTGVDLSRFGISSETKD